MSPLATVPLRRLLRGARGWLTVAFWVMVALLPAVVERTRASGHGADHALLGYYSTISVPFLAYAIVSQVLGGDGLGASGIVLVGFGARPARVALSAVAVAMAGTALVCGLLGAAVDVVAHGALDPPLAGDAARAALAGALGGAAYASFFALGASFGMRGFGRSMFLVLDWIFGEGTDASAMLVPRGHLHNLLGGLGPLEVSPRASLVTLLILAAAYAALAAGRARRTRWVPAASR